LGVPVRRLKLQHRVSRRVIIVTKSVVVKAKHRYLSGERRAFRTRWENQNPVFALYYELCVNNAPLSIFSDPTHEIAW